MRSLIAIMAVLLLLVQYKLWFGDGNVGEILQLQQAVNTQQTKNSKLRERNRALAAQVKDLKTGLDAVEEIARRELGMIGEHETFYQIVQRPDPQSER